MAKVEYTADEVAEFEKRFRMTPGWKQWQRRDGRHGEDVLEIAVDGNRPAIIKVAKTGGGGFIATGFDGWALTVADEFAELLDVLAMMGPRRLQTHH